MAIRTIRTDEDPILRKKSREVEKFDENLKNLIEDMKETMYEAQGVGLAAVQVGILKKAIVIDDYEGTKLELINPIFKSREGEVDGMEGCLSVPEKMGKICRAEKVTIQYQDLQGKKKNLEAEGFLARIIQHEMDHLDGILYTDKATEMYDVEKQGE
ncbi:peptide deformylase [Peptoniphilus sp. KCTC 25270]|uniref:peptide deformylase n=1 Tax=Peptoniphilus sp. KCTC 25270 TaxID=2897414 RepID=UPI001E37FAE0|nr:peptide deformylase [Peptoniphilus sp. KCTC 25270]MCD1147116.1 peptide deformylase [Peptoniphilus sp. KCTC 25270]